MKLEPACFHCMGALVSNHLQTHGPLRARAQAPRDNSPASLPLYGVGKCTWLERTACIQ